MSFILGRHSWIPCRDHRKWLLWLKAWVTSHCIWPMAFLVSSLQVVQSSLNTMSASLSYLLWNSILALSSTMGLCSVRHYTNADVNGYGPQAGARKKKGSTRTIVHAIDGVSILGPASRQSRPQGPRSLVFLRSILLHRLGSSFSR
jgi:hypothetical protein